jgi:hypothetical protein
MLPDEDTEVKLETFATLAGNGGASAVKNLICFGAPAKLSQHGTRNF